MGVLTTRDRSKQLGVQVDLFQNFSNTSKQGHWATSFYVQLFPDLCYKYHQSWSLHKKEEENKFLFQGQMWVVSGIDIKFIFSADHIPGPISSSAGARF